MKLKDCPCVYILEEKGQYGNLFWGIENSGSDNSLKALESQ